MRQRPRSRGSRSPGSARGRALATGLALALAACGGRAPGTSAPQAAASAWDVAAERALPEAGLVERLAAHRFVLLGELHDNPEHHRVQARLLRAMVAAGRRPAVVFEMLSADRADAVARTLEAPGAGPEALRRAVAWDESGWPAWELYAPVFEAALEAGLPVVPGDVGTATLDALRRGGVEGLDPPTRAALDLARPASPLEEAVLGDAIREGHCDLLPESALPRMIDVQRARDAHLAAALVDAAARPDADGAVLIAGAGHARRDVAVPAWIARRVPDAHVLSLALLEAEPPPTDPARRLAERFPGRAPYDLVVFTDPAPREDPCEALRRQLEDGPPRRG